MEPDQPLTRAEAQALLGYVQATYGAVTATRRRVAGAVLTVAIVFAVLAASATVEWATTRSAVDEVRDTPLVEALGVQIPDPRPAIERGQLRLQALVWGVIATAAAAVALLSLIVFLLVRPPRAPILPARQVQPPPAAKKPSGATHVRRTP